MTARAQGAYCSTFTILSNGYGKRWAADAALLCRLSCATAVLNGCETCGVGGGGRGESGGGVVTCVRDETLYGRR